MLVAPSSSLTKEAAGVVCTDVAPPPDGVGGWLRAVLGLSLLPMRTYHIPLLSPQSGLVLPPIASARALELCHLQCSSQGSHRLTISSVLPFKYAPKLGGQRRIGQPCALALVHQSQLEERSMHGACPVLSGDVVNVFNVVQAVSRRLPLPMRCSRYIIVVMRPSGGGPFSPYVVSCARGHT
jgi:hypothetical protein